MKRFRIAFSFAREKRDFVAKVAAILAKKFGEDKTLYDKYYEAEFANADLGIDLPDLYHKESDLVVLVICKDYESKEWCGLEWRAIHALIMERKAKDVMLCRFDHALIKGLYRNAGFAELDAKMPEQAAALILERLALNEGHPKNHYTSGASAGSARHITSVPNNLPRLSCFFGRELQLATIRKSLDPARRTWGALIHGPGGMGKTSLAVQAALDAPSDWFTRIIFLSAKKREMTSNGPRDRSDYASPTFLEMLDEIGRLHGHGHLSETSEDKRVRLIGEALEEEQSLLVLDNLETLPDDQQDRMFTFLGQLPGRCKAIVTSRKRPVDEGSVIRLGRLTKGAALDYLNELATNRQILQRAPEKQRVRLYEETGGNPLLMRWVVGQLGRGKCGTIARAIQFLSTAPENNSALDFIFGDIAHGLSKNEIKAINGLDGLNEPASAKTLAKRAKLTITAAETVLSDLTDRGLVDADTEEEFFSVLPVVVAYVRQLTARKLSQQVAVFRSRNSRR